jgi:hypothetical protein
MTKEYTIKINDKNVTLKPDKTYSVKVRGVGIFTGTFQKSFEYTEYSILYKKDLDVPPTQTHIDPQTLDGEPVFTDVHGNEFVIKRKQRQRYRKYRPSRRGTEADPPSSGKETRFIRNPLPRPPVSS